MPRVCHFTGKHTTFGNQITTRGKAKYLGGVGTKTTGITARKYRPNIQRVRAVIDGQIVRIDEYMDSAQVAPIGAAVAAVDTAQELLALKCSALAHGPRRRPREMMARAGQTPTLP